MGARPQSTDFLHSMRFHVTTDADFLTTAAGGVTNTPAGFMSCTTPEATTEAVEYREGLYNYAKKFPGTTTVSDCSLQKGATKGDSTFWYWLSTVIHGGGEYRVTMTIQHFDRTALKANSAKRESVEKINMTVEPARAYVLYNAFPTRHKVAADLDASTSDVSIMELDVAYEYFDVVEGEALTADAFNEKQN